MGNLSLRRLLNDIHGNMLPAEALPRAAVTIGRFHDTAAVMSTLVDLLDHDMADVRRAALIGIDTHLQLYSPRPPLRVLNRVLKMAANDKSISVRAVAENVVFLVQVLYN